MRNYYAVKPEQKICDKIDTDKMRDNMKIEIFKSME